jgi:hypothetical protein
MTINMAESANSNTLDSALSELKSEIPDQLAGSQEFEETDTLTGRDIVFSLLCNSSQYGAPLFQFLEQYGQLHSYRNAREQITSKLLCLATDILRPPLTYKAQELHRIRKSLRKLQRDADDTNSVSRFFEILQCESTESTKFREELLSQDPDAEHYRNGEILRLYSVTELMKKTHPPGSIQQVYQTELTKFTKALELHKDNNILMFLFLDDSPHAIAADAQVKTPYITMTTILTEDEQYYVQTQLGLKASTDFKSLISDDNFKLIQRMSLSRFKPDASFGTKNYAIPNRLIELDWIHTEVSDELLASLTTIPQIRSDTSQPEARFPTVHDDVIVQKIGESSVSHTRPKVTLISPPPTPPRRDSMTKRTASNPRQPEPFEAGRLGIRGREQQFLFQQQQLRLSSTQKQTTSQEPDTNIPMMEATSSDEIDMTNAPADTSLFDFEISGDSCSQLLAAMIPRIATHLQRRGATVSYLATLPSHRKRFGKSASHATQMVREELRPTDRLVTLCDSTSSLRYIVTVDKLEKRVYLNRVLHHRWNRWS